ncbi:MAG: hypothetical protein AAF243_11490 [Cyanobacteria bacterium P01_A01_bin.137]
MSSVLPINTQRYESGDYTLEVTAHPSALSQWSDRPVVRQLRFSLWTNQPTRQRLAAGDQQQLLTLSETVEAYVQRHLTHAAWPHTHRLQLLDQAVDLSTLQLFGLAEVFNAYGQRQITLPAASKRRRSRWWAGSVAASLLVSVGVATVYLRERPVLNAVTSQAPEAVLEDEVAVTPPSVRAPATVPIPETNEAPDPVPAAPAASSDVADGIDDDGPAFKASRELAQRPNVPEFEDSAGASGADSVEPQGPDEELAPSLDVAEALERPPETLSADRFEQAAAPEAVAEAPVEPPPAASVMAPAPETAIRPEEETLDSSTDLGFSDLEPGMARSSRPEDALLTTGVDGAILNAIATHFAPYQPSDVPYPLVYRLQIGSDGTILELAPITENAPTIQAEALTPPPGRLLQLELTYTGAGLPTVRELQ